MSTETIVTTLTRLRAAAEAPAMIRPGLYAAILEPLPKQDVIDITMVLAEGNRHGADSARNLAGML